MRNESSTPSVEHVFEFVLEVETHLKLLEWKIASEPVWEIIKYGFCRSLLVATGALENSKAPIDKKQLNPLMKFRTITSLVNAVVRHQIISKLQFRQNREAMVGVFPFYRRNRENTDVLSFDLVQALGSRAYMFGVGEGDKTNSSVLHRDWLNALFSRAYGSAADRWLEENIKEPDIELYRAIVRKCEKRFGITITGIWENLPTGKIKSFLTQTRGYERLFKLLGFKTIFIVNAIQPGIIGGARRSGVRIVELQHGSISRFHPLHNWSTSSTPSTVPDEFWVWGESWIQGVRFGATTKPIVVGAVSSYETVRTGREPETKGLVAFMSSADVTEKLFATALKCAAENPDLEFIYKAHPREDLNRQLLELQERTDLRNLTILEHENSALALIKRSEYVVGVNSTTLFEAAGMEKRVAVIKVSGWEFVHSLISLGGAVAYSPESAISSLKDTPRAKNPYSFYAKPIQIDLSAY